MKLSSHKTKIVCTIGPASHSESVLKDLMKQGMDVARLNFSHGTWETHREAIQRIRSVAAELGRDCLILADLPGPKIRIGAMQDEPVMLIKGESVTLTTRPAHGTAKCISVNYDHLPGSVSRGNQIYLNDGFIQLTVQAVTDTEVQCHIDVGGPLLSFKGLNLPNAKLFIEPITEQDLALLKFGLSEGVNTFGVSFVEKAKDLLKLRAVAQEQGKPIQLIAKIERTEAIENIDEILEAADGIMVARGDLGVQMAIEDIPRMQKSLIRRANLRGRPVITATQMLESMTHHIRPTRAEVTDVANAILDGTDAVMLSEETAIGTYPVETVAMMAKIATSIEIQQETPGYSPHIPTYLASHMDPHRATVEDVIAMNVSNAIQSLPVRCIVAPTHSGNTPRSISRLKPNCWVFAFTQKAFTHHFLALSYGVHSFMMEQSESILTTIKSQGLAQTGDTVIITEGISSGQTGWTNSLRIVTLPD